MDNGIVSSEPRAGQTKDYKISSLSVSAQQAALRIKSKYWWAKNKKYICSKFIFICITMERYYDATADGYVLRIPGLNRQRYPAGG